MRPSLVARLRCPRCTSHELELAVVEQDGREIRRGSVTCRGCAHVAPIDGGIVDLLGRPTETVVSEQRGWVELVGDTRDTSLVEQMLLLPHLDADIWRTTAENFHQALDEIDLTGCRVLDVGAGRCWSSRHCLDRGAAEVVAVDIVRERFIGLETADIFFERAGLFFERLLADMNRLPLAADQFDVVLFSGTLHHSSAPEAALVEAARVVRRGGHVIVTNEPVRRLLHRPDFSTSPEVAQGINENVYSLPEYLRAARTAGLAPRLVFPRSISERISRDELELVAQELGPHGARLVVPLAGGRFARALLPLFYLVASMPLVMLAKKV